MRELLTVAIGLALTISASAADLTQAARIAVKKELLDPGSALFRSIAVKKGAVCGMVSAKNEYGGYSDPALFVYLASGKVYVLDRHSGNGPRWAAEAIAAYRAHCL